MKSVCWPAKSSSSIYLVRPWDGHRDHKLTVLTALSTVASNMTNTLFDLLSHPEAAYLIEELRQESLDVFLELTAESIAIRDMVKADSVFREDLGSNPLDNRTGARDVVQEGGLITPDGTYLPQGTRVTIAVGYAMRDPEFAGINNPGHYDPFRLASRTNFYRLVWANMYVLVISLRARK